MAVAHLRDSGQQRQNQVIDKIRESPLSSHAQPTYYTVFLHLPPASAMAAASPPPKGHENTVSFLDGAIESLDLAEISNIAPAKVVFGSTGVLLGTIKVRFPTPHGWPSNSPVSRTQWWTNKITSNLGFLAPTYVKLSTGD